EGVVVSWAASSGKSQAEGSCGSGAHPESGQFWFIKAPCLQHSCLLSKRRHL
ncbi:hypothetical protein AVDCRST_MAG84-706, partial [uncultured Microcoleus sp.]